MGTTRRALQQRDSHDNTGAAERVEEGRGLREKQTDLWKLGIQHLGGTQAGSLAELALIDQCLVSTHGLVG